MTEKTCTKCGETRSTSDFHKLARAKDGLQYWCKVCMKGYAADHYAVQANSDAKRELLLMKRYGITAQQYDGLNEAQEGKCAICGKTCTTGNRLAVDHDHTSGKVRGLLCLNCNQGLGKFFDDPALFAKAIEYLTAT